MALGGWPFRSAGTCILAGKRPPWACIAFSTGIAEFVKGSTLGNHFLYSTDLIFYIKYSTHFCSSPENWLRKFTFNHAGHHPSCPVWSEMSSLMMPAVIRCLTNAVGCWVACLLVVFIVHILLDEQWYWCIYRMLVASFCCGHSCADVMMLNGYSSHLAYICTWYSKQPWMV